jgi:flagellar basal body-associated protein FliL
MKRKIEFSKIIMIVVGAVTLIVTAFTLIIVFTTGDTSPLAYLIPAVFAEFATATGFYYSKAKSENQIKLRKKYGSDIYNDSKGDY